MLKIATHFLIALHAFAAQLSYDAMNGCRRRLLYQPSWQLASHVPVHHVELLIGREDVEGRGEQSFPSLLPSKVSLERDVPLSVHTPGLQVFVCSYSISLHITIIMSRVH